MKVYLVRHGECQSNLLKIYNTVDEDLNDTGIKQAEELRDDVDKIDYDVIISSPLVRAYHTAEIINVHDKKIIIDNLSNKDLCELIDSDYYFLENKIAYKVGDLK